MTARWQLTWTAPAGSGPAAPHGLPHRAGGRWAEPAGLDGNGGRHRPLPTYHLERTRGLAAATPYHYQVSCAQCRRAWVNPPGKPPGTSAAAAWRCGSRPPIPLTAHAWPAAHRAGHPDLGARMPRTVTLDVTAQGAGGGGWYRALRFGQAARGPYWLPASAVRGHGRHHRPAPGPRRPRGPAEHRHAGPGGPDLERARHRRYGGPATGCGGRAARRPGPPSTCRPGRPHLYLYGQRRDHGYAATSTGCRRRRRRATGPAARALTAAVTPPPPRRPRPTSVPPRPRPPRVQLAWDPVPGASGYDVEIQQSHGDSYVLLPATGTFALRTGPETTDSVTVTVTRPGTTLQLDGAARQAMAAGACSCAPPMRGVTPHGASVSVSNDPASSWRPVRPPG